MCADVFHDKKFNEGTLTKLALFELYARQWLPVFLSQPDRPWKSVHVFDFFAGPGCDSQGEPGSPLRILRQLNTFSFLPAWPKTKVVAHFFDSDAEKIESLKRNVENSSRPEGLTLDIRALNFSDALDEYESVLNDRHEAKLLFVDQYGVQAVTPAVFQQLVRFPVSDFLFFLSSSVLYRFHGHPALDRQIERPDDYYEVHKRVLNSYREELPSGMEYFLAPFSIKKGSNIYGIVFGSAHPKGMDKFLEVAWKQDEVNGEANFDINRESITKDEPFLPLQELRPTKLTDFERNLEAAIRAKRLHDERDVVRFCYSYGVRRQHAAVVLQRLKKEGVINPRFRVPKFDRRPSPLPLR
jgi:three-Cys-motif partner protein